MWRYKTSINFVENACFIQKNKEVREVCCNIKSWFPPDEMANKQIDYNKYVGKKYGRLTLIGKDFEKSINKKVTWVLCDCECGTKNISVSWNNLNQGSVKSCGCLHKDGIKKRAAEKRKRSEAIICNNSTKPLIKDTVHFNNGKWKVYMHLFPNNKVYIGITSQQDYFGRFKNGRGYSSQTVIFNAIKKYGWENIQHFVIADGLSMVQAKQMEIELISEYRSNYKRFNNPSFGYNATDGGDAIPENNTPKYNEELLLLITNSWNKKNTDESVSDVAKDVRCCQSTVRKYLKYGTAIGLCYYNPKNEAEKKYDYQRSKMCKDEICMYDKEGRYLKTFSNKKEVADFIGHYVCYDNNHIHKSYTKNHYRFRVKSENYMNNIEPYTKIS